MMGVGWGVPEEEPDLDLKQKPAFREEGVQWAVGWEEVVGSIKPFQRLGFVVLFLRQVLSAQNLLGKSGYRGPLA